LREIARPCSARPRRIAITDPQSNVVFTVPDGNEQYNSVVTGGKGGDGRDGGGLTIPGVGTIGVTPTAGGSGGTPALHEVTIAATESGGLIESDVDNLAGIRVGSVGGNGGQGGDSYGNDAGRPGGAAGNGGTVIAHNYVNVSASGTNSHGMWVYSQAGSGGSGGSGYIFSSGVGGGAPAAGGAATGENFATLTTQGQGDRKSVV